MKVATEVVIVSAFIRFGTSSPVAGWHARGGYPVRRGSAAWIGFALFGWTYALVAFSLTPPLHDDVVQAAEVAGRRDAMGEIVRLAASPTRWHLPSRRDRDY